MTFSWFSWHDSETLEAEVEYSEVRTFKMLIDWLILIFQTANTATLGCCGVSLCLFSVTKGKHWFPSYVHLGLGNWLWIILKSSSAKKKYTKEISMAKLDGIHRRSQNVNPHILCPLFISWADLEVKNLRILQ